MMTCAWCSRPIPPGKRSDSVCCSKRCRQARHRFTRDVGSASAVATGHPRRLAYADPPYPGRARKYYGQHPDYAGEVDHAALVASLTAEYDAWALSTAADSLQDILAVCPPGVRVAAWHRGERPHKDATAPLNAWEPVIYWGQIRRVARPLDATRRVEQLEPVAEDLHDASRPPGGVASAVEHDASRPTRGDASQGSARRVDSIVDASEIRDELRAEIRHLEQVLEDLDQPSNSLVFRPWARTTDPERVVGAKPAAFWRWVFELLGATPIDSFVDVFPASGGGTRAWDTYVQASRLTAVAHDASQLEEIRRG